MDGIWGINEIGITYAQQAHQMLQAIRDVRSGKASVTDPPTRTILHYKLDPDEPGLLKSASPSGSQLAVTGQEISNANRLSNEARARGEDVVSVKVSYKTDIVDGKLAIRAGHTEVISRDRRAAEYTQLGQAKQQAALGSFDPRLNDDAVLRSLVGGLTPLDGLEHLSVPEIFARELENAEPELTKAMQALARKPI